MQSIAAEASSPSPSGGSRRRADERDDARASAPSHTRVGTDIVAVADVAESIARFGDKYVARVFTPAEIAYCTGRGESAPLHFAARFAAKEAVMKVLRPSKDEPLDWQAIEVVRSPSGACEIVLRGAAESLARRDEITSLAVSLSHEAAYAVAVVLASIGGIRAASSPSPHAYGSARVSPVSRIATGSRAGFKCGRTAKVGSCVRGSRGGVSVR